MGNDTSYWWCPKCKVEVHPERVTYEEIHEDCGTGVVCRDLTEGTITWLKIEDAPKDGTPILVYSPELDTFAFVKWDGTGNEWGLGCFINAKGQDVSKILPVMTHFAYINPPEVQDGK